ncbi:hypothetical protein O0L34_g230 [Tuta absoluta]|nr:hypothetical protein O0L34_g230 [Tuta absoluta]
MGWGPEKSHLFVKLYLSHKSLWNIDDEEYKLKQKRSESYRDISKKFHALTNTELTETEVRIKIKSMRSTYIQYLQKLRRERLSVEVLNNSLVWFKDMHKCFSSINIPRNFYEEGVSYDQQEDLETNLENSTQNIAVDTLEEDTSDNPSDPFISPTNDDYVLLLKHEPEDEPTIPFKRKRKYKWSNRESIESSLNNSGDCNTRGTISKEDEFDIYGKYIASQLREMGLQRALRVQLQIQNIVSEARLDSLSD